MCACLKGQKNTVTDENQLSYCPTLSSAAEHEDGIQSMLANIYIAMPQMLTIKVVF